MTLKVGDKVRWTLGGPFWQDIRLTEAPSTGGEVWIGVDSVRGEGGFAENELEIIEQFTGTSTGGATAYYDFPEGFKTLNDLIEYKNMPFWRGNIFKATFRLGEKDVATEEYDLNKIIYFANRRLDMLKRGRDND